MHYMVEMMVSSVGTLNDRHFYQDVGLLSGSLGKTDKLAKVLLKSVDYYKSSKGLKNKNG